MRSATRMAFVLFSDGGVESRRLCLLVVLHQSTPIAPNWRYDVRSNLAGALLPVIKSGTRIGTFKPHIASREPAPFAAPSESQKEVCCQCSHVRKTSTCTFLSGPLR